MTTKINPALVIGYRQEVGPTHYDVEDAIAYALSVGVSLSQPDAPKFLFSGRDDFCVIPTYSTLEALNAWSMYVIGENTISGLPPFDYGRVVHSDHYVEVHAPLSPSGSLLSDISFVDVLDKGERGAVLSGKVNVYNQDKLLVATHTMSLFLIGYGDFGGQKTSTNMKPMRKVPSRKPDAVVQEKTSVDQAVMLSTLDRRSKAPNNIHLETESASKGGFKAPLLQGLCTFGFAARHVMMQCANNNMTRFKAMQARFSGPVHPGQTIQTEMWQDGNRIDFQCKVAETGQVVVSNAYVDLKVKSQL
ncbi:peroxisomal multifunctional enzyme type 2-like [Glandiceps talaboti]